MLFNGKSAGLSGVLGGLFNAPSQDRTWRLSFVVGLIAGGLGLLTFAPEAFTDTVKLPLWSMAIAGLLVGVGTRMGGGCTSGHGVCGLPRLSKRSFVAVGVFMFTGCLATWVTMNWTLLGAS
jgi:uncharacterized membrane protein YedE/YeeE